MKLGTAIIGFLLVGSVGVLAGLYIGLKHHPIPEGSPKVRVMRYSELPSPPQPEVVEKVEAAYPESALKEKYEGKVTIIVVINHDGKVNRAWVNDTKFSGPDYKPRQDLVAAALEAAQKWRFKPSDYYGNPTLGWAIIPFTFKLDSATSTR